MVMGCALVGLGFVVPTIVYRNENLPMPIRVLIHIAVAFLIWFLFMRHYRAEAKKMNDKIQAMK